MVLLHYSAIDVDFEVGNMTVLFGSDTGQTLSQGSIENTLTTPAEIRIIDDFVFEGQEAVSVLFLASSVSISSGSMSIIIVDDEGNVIRVNITRNNSCYAILTCV